MRDFILGTPKITADGDCSHEIKRRLLLGRKATGNLENISFKAVLTRLRNLALGINWGTGQMGCLSPSLVLTYFKF